MFILDQPIEIEGPADQSATLVVEHGIICALPRGGGALVLRNLTVRSTGAPALTLAGPCSIEFCNISGTGVGVQVTAGDGEERPRLVQNTVVGCGVGLHFAGGTRALLDGNRLEKNTLGVVIVGLELPEGRSEGLAALQRTKFGQNEVADVQLMSLGVQIAGANGKLHRIDAASDIKLRRFGDTCCVAARTDLGSLVLRVDRTETYAAVSEPFEDNVLGVLPRRGRWCTAPLPGLGTGLRERKRDFARLVAPGGPCSFLVVAPGASPPTHWARESSDAVASTDVTAEAGEAAAADLAAWLCGAMRETGSEVHPHLVDRCIALLSAGEGVSFAITYALTPVLLQPHFVLFVNPRGEVRIGWFVYVTNEARPDTRNGGCLVRLLTEDLNSGETAKDGAGVVLHFAASATDEPSMAQIVARNTGALRRAVDEGAWDLVLAAE